MKKTLFDLPDSVEVLTSKGYTNLEIFIPLHQQPVLNQISLTIPKGQSVAPRGLGGGTTRWT
jgi:hypothetical protein